MLFSIPSSAASLTIDITEFTATDNIAVNGYLLTETSTKPSIIDANWTPAPPETYTFATQGSKTLYAWAKDAAGNISNSLNDSVTITLPDTTRPTVTAFTIPSTAASLTVPITVFTATDNVAVTGYLVTQTASTPSGGNPNWKTSRKLFIAKTGLSISF